MFNINKETKQIELTRGNVATIGVTAKNDDETDYIFVVGDIVRFKIFEKKDCEKVVLQKDVKVTEQTDIVNVELTGEETKIGGLINKPVDYWYEIELNPDTNTQTIIGYDKNGPKIFTLYPEGGDKK